MNIIGIVIGVIGLIFILIFVWMIVLFVRCKWLEEECRVREEVYCKVLECN